MIHPEESTEPEDVEIIDVESEELEFVIESPEEGSTKGTQGGNGGTVG
jgi:hypothetical protein